MTAPQLNRKLTLEERLSAPDGAGGFVETWSVLGTLWAQVEGRSGREVGQRPAASVSQTSLRITVRAAPFGSPSRPKPDQRFRDGARILRILAVSERDPNGAFLTCFAQEEVAG